jgi:DNA invertase Pin-like site-specific DNA recombinase
MATAYSYVRVSSRGQAARFGGTGISEEEQRLQCRACWERELQHQGIEWGGFREDAAISASKRPFLERPAGRQLIHVLRPGDHLIVAKSSRAFRDLPDCLNTERMLTNYGVYVHCLDLNFDTSTPMGKLMRAVLAAIDEWYSDQLSERMLDVHAYLRANNRMVGTLNKFKPWGNHRGPDKTLIPDPVERKVMEWVLHEIHFGIGNYGKIYKRLKELEAQGALVLSRAWKGDPSIELCRKAFWTLVRREGVDWIQDEQLREWARGQIGANGQRIGATPIG